MRKPSRLHAKGHLLEITAGVAAALACASPVAFAQSAEQPDAKPASSAPAGNADAATAEEMEAVTVVGTRAAQRTSIERKKRAATAVDSIAAEDVGKFPDQNVSEAISRIAGVALDRGDSGEGQGISVRGNGMETTRVDIDGMTVLNTNGALSSGLNAGGGRAADLRELPSAIIKSIDVFKGTTADMTEGSLGGSVHIETRNGLDFDKPFLLFSSDGQQNSITEKWTPSGSLIFANSFMDNRFGVFASVNYSKFETTTDLQQPQRPAMPDRPATPISINRRKRPLPTTRASSIRPRRPEISVFLEPAGRRLIRRCRPSTFSPGRLQPRLGRTASRRFRP